jgi:hypothetical protein
MVRLSQAHEHGLTWPASPGGGRPTPTQALEGRVATVLALQRTAGNQAVGKALASNLLATSERAGSPIPSAPASGVAAGDHAASLVRQELQRAVKQRSLLQRASAARLAADRVSLQRQAPAASESEHLNRNRFNVLPKGKLTPIDDASPEFVYKEGRSNRYRDEAGLVWELLSDDMNEFHQPKGATKPYPNKKFLHRDASGGSSEAIRQPDGTYLVTGPLQGTYNFVHPESKYSPSGLHHGVVDVLPHLFSDDYVAHPPLDASTPNVDTYRQRYELEVGTIGHVPDYTGATGGTFFDMIYIRDGAVTRPAIASWWTTFGPWGHWRFVRWISPEMEKLAEARQKAQTGGKAVEIVNRSDVKGVK